jgi:uncharacterized protein YhhL (DUF1145 family)
MFAVMKLGCLVIYALALAALAGLFRAPLARDLELLGAGFLVVHALELPFAFRVLRRYAGPLAASVLLALLFGVLHWKPLARAA